MELIESIEDAKMTEYIRQGYYIELYCCICTNELTLTAYNQQEIIEQMKHLGWSYIMSDRCQVSGFYCGCDYRKT